jgi:hypothetical protein
MNRLLALAAAIEAVMGLTLMIDPSLVARLLLGNGVSGPGVAVGRVAGIALIALGLACWPTSNVAGGAAAACRAMFTYNLLVSTYLGFLGNGGQSVGRLLWPVVAIHAVMTVMFAFALIQHGRFLHKSAQGD